MNNSRDSRAKKNNASPKSSVEDMTEIEEPEEFAAVIPEKTRADNKKRHCNRYKKLLEFKDLQKLSGRLKKQGCKITFTIGSFDLLSAGHCRYLSDAKATGHKLVVGISSDASDRRVKGARYSLISEDLRAELISCLKVVDYVTIVDNDRPHASLIMLQPDTFFTCEYDWQEGLRDKQDEAVIEMYGGGIFRDPIYKPYYNISGFVDRVAHIRFLQILQFYLKEKMPELAFTTEPDLKPIDFGKQTPRNLFAFNANNLIYDFSSPEESVALEALLEGYRKEGLKTLLVSGSYDLLHIGHARFIEQASLLADVAIVATPSDAAVRQLKGTGRPIISERSRAYVLASLDFVDHVVIFPETGVLETLRKTKPDIFYTVEDSWNKGYKDSPEYRFVTSYGGKVVRGPRQSSHISTSAIIDKVAQEKVREIFKDCMDEERYTQILKERSRLNGK